MTFLKDIWLKTRYITLYGLLMAILVFVLKWSQWRFLILDNALDIYIGLIAVFFTVLGVSDGAVEYFGPVLLLVLTVASWYFRPASRKLVSVNL